MTRTAYHDIAEALAQLGRIVGVVMKWTLLIGFAGCAFLLWLLVAIMTPPRRRR